MGQAGNITASNHGQERAGIVSRSEPPPQNPIIAGPLAFLARLPGCDPRQWILPVTRSGQLDDQLGQRIPAGNVPTLMVQNDFLLSRTPFIHRTREQ